ncbi:hypothetical protein IE53DRAFT_386555 [Violaceomyces palustris]|uniref:Uncharacterized protein n=1 Tax=Violaceomyces palustris TaxID=1673888 RepID=A0ACD0NZD1_9BASI|nr:hypothetical protein IE53DRAFT_386555 [Violaceomyces palustris]
MTETQLSARDPRAPEEVEVTDPSLSLGEDKVKISIEPAVILSEDQRDKILNDKNRKPSDRIEFEREKKLGDISVSGQQVFIESRPSCLDLQARVLRLWAERGDFSKFSTAALEKGKSVTTSSTRSRSPSYEADFPSYGIPSDEETDDEMIHREKEGSLAPIRVKGKGKAEGEAPDAGNKVNGGTIKESDFAQLRDEVLGRLDLAHFSSIHAHQLIGMLLKSSRRLPPGQSAAGSSGLAPPGQPSSSSGLARVDSPAPSSSTGTVTKPQEEFVLDPYSIALSGLKSDVGSAQQPDSYAQESIASSSGDAAQKLRDLKLSLAQKRASLVNAAQLLKDGAKELRSSHGPERERWRGFRELKERGWGLTPGRPLLDLERFGSTKEEGVAAGLRGFGTPIVMGDGKIKEEGARDAWIGYGMPEGSLGQRRRTLAYWSDTSLSAAANRKEDEAMERRETLVFPDRPRRRLRVRFILHQPVELKGDSGADVQPIAAAGGERIIVWTSDQPAEEESEEESGKPEEKGLGDKLDEELQAAQREMTDEDLFHGIISQSRSLGSFFTTTVTESSVSVEVTSALELCFEMVPVASPTTGATEQSRQASVTPGGKGGAARSTRSSEPKVEVEEHYRFYSPLASLVLTFARFAPIRRLERQRALSEIIKMTDPHSRQMLAKARASSSSSSSSSKARGGVGRRAAGVGGGGEAARSDAIENLDILGPILTILHYASFIHRLNHLLTEAVSNFNKEESTIAKGISNPESRARFTLEPMENVKDILRWISTLVQGAPDSATSSPHTTESNYITPETTTWKSQTSGYLHGLDLGGSATLWVGQRCICIATVSSPSSLTVQFPMKKTPQGLGVTLPLDLVTFEGLLDREMRMALSN